MGSTPWDGLVDSLSPNEPERSAAQLRLSPTIQPTAEVAWGTEYLSPPLADRAYAGAWVQSANGAAGQRGGIILGQTNTSATAFVRDQIGAWFWYAPANHNTAGSVDIQEHIAILPVGNIGIVSIGARNRTTMSAAPARLAAHAVITTTPLGALLSLTGWSPPNFGFHREWGPFFKPPGLVVFISGPTLQRASWGSFRWIELPNPRT